MNYKNTFIIIVIISFIAGLFYSILNNKIIVIKDQNNNISNNLRKKYNENSTNNILYENEHNNGFLSKENNKRNNIIPIAINIDNRYYLQAIVFLTSLLENIGSTTKYEIYIMIPNNFNHNSKKSIDSLLDKYGKEKIQIKYLNMKDSFRIAITSDHISTSAYYRLLLSSMLPKIDKIIYSDCDVINFEDLTNMYNIKLKDNIYFRGALDYYWHNNELLEYGVYSNMYINSGILLMNLKSLRKNGIEKEIIELCEKNYLEHHDQTAINLVCSGYIDKLPIKYALFNFESYFKLLEYNNEQSRRYRYSEYELKEAYHNPVMLHYAGFSKPWNHKNAKFEEYWWYYAQISDFYEEILSSFGYTYDQVETLIKNIPNDGGFIRFF